MFERDERDWRETRDSMFEFLKTSNFGSRPLPRIAYLVSRALRARTTARQ